VQNYYKDNSIRTICIYSYTSIEQLNAHMTKITTLYNVVVVVLIHTVFETGISLPVDNVIDTAEKMVVRYDNAKSIFVPYTRTASVGECLQRRGRVGRNHLGRYYRRKVDLYPVPELLTEERSLAYLWLKLCGYTAFGKEFDDVAQSLEPLTIRSVVNLLNNRLDPLLIRLYMDAQGRYYKDIYPAMRCYMNRSEPADVSLQNLASQNFYSSWFKIASPHNLSEFRTYRSPLNVGSYYLIEILHFAYSMHCARVSVSIATDTLAEAFIQPSYISPRIVLSDTDEQFPESPVSNRAVSGDNSQLLRRIEQMERNQRMLQQQNTELMQRLALADTSRSVVPAVELSSFNEQITSDNSVVDESVEYDTFGEPLVNVVPAAAQLMSVPVVARRAVVNPAPRAQVRPRARAAVSSNVRVRSAAASRRLPMSVWGSPADDYSVAFNICCILPCYGLCCWCLFDKDYADYEHLYAGRWPY